MTDTDTQRKNGKGVQSGLKPLLSHVQTRPLDGRMSDRQIRSRVPWFLLSHGPEAEVRVGVEANLESTAVTLTPPWLIF